MQRPRRVGGGVVAVRRTVLKCALMLEKSQMSPLCTIRPTASKVGDLHARELATAEFRTADQCCATFP